MKPEEASSTIYESLVSPITRRTFVAWMAQASLFFSLNACSRPYSLRVLPIFPTDMDTQFGTGADPDMFNTSVRWPLIMTTEEKQIAKALCDLIIPEDTLAPSASAVGTVEFIDEWTSAPYPEHVNARLQVGNLLQWLNQEAAASYRKRFDELALFEQRLLCDRVCDPANAAANLMTIAECFSLFRFLVVGAYFTSPAGIKFIDYLGNTPTFTFGGPPPEVLRHLGLVPEI